MQVTMFKVLVVGQVMRSFTASALEMVDDQFLPLQNAQTL